MKKSILPALLIFGLVSYFAYQSNTRSEPPGEFIGTAAPPLEVEEWISEKPQLAGKYLLVDFWATWCGPCLRGIPHLNDLHAAFPDRLAIVGLSSESRAQVESMKSPRMDYYSAIDTQGRLGSYFKVRSIPHVVLTDPAGVVLYKGHPARLTASKVEALLPAN